MNFDMCKSVQLTHCTSRQNHFLSCFILKLITAQFTMECCSVHLLSVSLCNDVFDQFYLDSVPHGLMSVGLGFFVIETIFHQYSSIGP